MQWRLSLPDFQINGERRHLQVLAICTAPQFESSGKTTLYGASTIKPKAQAKISYL